MIYILIYNLTTNKCQYKLLKRINFKFKYYILEPLKIYSF